MTRNNLGWWKAENWLTMHCSELVKRIRWMNLEILVLRWMTLYLQNSVFVVWAHVFCSAQHPSILSWCLDDTPWTQVNHHGFKSPSNNMSMCKGMTIPDFDVTIALLFLDPYLRYWSLKISLWHCVSASQSNVVEHLVLMYELRILTRGCEELVASCGSRLPKSCQITCIWKKWSQSNVQIKSKPTMCSLMNVIYYIHIKTIETCVKPLGVTSR